jgi:hypothetical protein
MIMYIVVGLGGGLVDLGRNLFGTVEDDDEDYVVETVEEDR